MAQQTHVFGCFKTTQGARLAADRLVEKGVPPSSLGMLISDQARQHLGTVERHTKLAEGAAAGGVAGGALGAVAAGLTTVAAIAAPGVGLLAAGPAVAMFAGAGAGAAAGATIGGTIGLSMSEHEIKRVNEIIEEAGVLVTVSTDSRELRELAEDVLEGSGAIVVKTHKGDFAHV